MQQEKDQLQFIQNEQQQFATTDAAGNVAWSSVATPLTDDPEGWQDEAVQFVRNPVLFGVFRSMSATFSFKKTSAKILRWLWYNFGIQAFAKLVILRRNNINQNVAYYSGNMDFTQSDDNEMGFDINIMEGGIVEYISANKDTTYEVPMNVPQAIDVVMDGIEMFSNVKAEVYADTLLNIENVLVPNLHNSGSVNIGILVADSETQYPSIEFNTFTSYLEGGNPPIPKDIWPLDWWLKATAPSHVTANAVLRASAATGLWFIRLYIYNESAGTSRLINLATGSTGGFVQDLEIPIAIDINMINGEKAWLFWEMDVSGDAEFVSFGHFPKLDNDTITLVYTYRKPATVVKMHDPLYVLESIVRQMTNNEYGAESLLLSDETKAKLFSLTCGDAIRGFADAIMRITLMEFFKGYNCRFGVGMGTTNTGKLIIEVKKHFYNDNNLVDLGEVKDCKFKPYLEGIPNNIKIGCQNKEYDDVNGRNEFNTPVEWSTPITKHAKELDLMSPIRFDCYGAERLRIDLEGKPTTDSISDNDTFMINRATTTFVGNVQFFALGSVYAISTVGRFQSVFVGSKITVTGSALNDGVYDVIAVTDGLTVSSAFTVQQAVITETAFGITLTSNQAALNRPIYESITGVISPDSIFNTELRPGLCIRAHSDYLRAAFDKLETKFLKYQTTSKNRNLAIKDNGVLIVEKDDILIGSLPGKLNLPIVATVTVNVPLNMTVLVETDQYAQVTWTWEKVVYKGFINKVGQNADLNKEQTYELLLAPSNNMQKRIV